MADIDELTHMMGESKVDPAALGQHPRFCQYKNATKAAEQQADRRRDALERQRDRRLDAQNHMRNLAENLESDDDEDEEEGQSAGDDEEKALDLSRQRPRWRRKNRYQDELMTSEWLVDIPEQLGQDWMMVPAPTGRRALVVATRGLTSAYNKGGRLLHQFKSMLPCRNDRYTILDCILCKDNTFYVLDVLCWNSNIYYDLPFDNRRFFLQSHMGEIPSLAISSNKCKFTFKMLPDCRCEKKDMEAMMKSEFDFVLDGLLFYYSQVLYTGGQSPLVGWLKPFMLPDLLGVQIPEKYIAANTDNLTAGEFIDQFNRKHRFVSHIAKDDEMSSTSSS